VCNIESIPNTTLVQLKANPPDQAAGGWDCFNTTLVQLKGEAPLRRECVRARRSFNTTLVQLKDGAAAQTSFRASMFQYHTGSIKSQVEFAAITVIKARFNTTLVQLKDDCYIPNELRFDKVSIPHWFN